MKEYYANAVTYVIKSPAINDYYSAKEQVEEWERNGLKGEDLEKAKKSIHYDEKKKKYDDARQYNQKQNSDIHEKMLNDTSIIDIENHSNIKRDDEVFKETASRRVEASKTTRSLVAPAFGPVGLAVNGTIDAYGKGAEQMEKGRGKDKMGSTDFDKRYRQAQATTTKQTVKTVMAGKSNAETAKDVWSDVVDAGKDEVWDTGWDKANEYIDNVQTGGDKGFEGYEEFNNALSQDNNSNIYNPNAPGQINYRDPLQDIIKKPTKKAYGKTNPLK